MPDVYIDFAAIAVLRHATDIGAADYIPNPDFDDFLKKIGLSEIPHNLTIFYDEDIFSNDYPAQFIEYLRKSGHPLAKLFEHAKVVPLQYQPILPGQAPTLIPTIAPILTNWASPKLVITPNSHIKLECEQLRIKCIKLYSAGECDRSDMAKHREIVRQQPGKKWTVFSDLDKTACLNEDSTMEETLVINTHLIEFLNQRHLQGSDIFILTARTYIEDDLLLKQQKLQSLRQTLTAEQQELIRRKNEITDAASAKYAALLRERGATIRYFSKYVSLTKSMHQVDAEARKQEKYYDDLLEEVAVKMTQLETSERELKKDFEGVQSYKQHMLAHQNIQAEFLKHKITLKVEKFSFNKELGKIRNKSDAIYQWTLDHPGQAMIFLDDDTGFLDPARKLAETFRNGECLCVIRMRLQGQHCERMIAEGIQAVKAVSSKNSSAFVVQALSSQPALASVAAGMVSSSSRCLEVQSSPRVSDDSSSSSHVTPVNLQPAEVWSSASGLTFLSPAPSSAAAQTVAHPSSVQPQSASAIDGEAASSPSSLATPGPIASALT